MILHVNHDDGDALGCSVNLCMKLIANKDLYKDKSSEEVIDELINTENNRYKVIFCGNNKQNDPILEMKKIMEETKESVALYITDISPSDEVAEEINKRFKAGNLVILIDHHETALHLNKYPWAMVQTKNMEGEAGSATDLLARMTTIVNYADPYIAQPNVVKMLDKFNNDIDLLDSYRWITPDAEILNMDSFIYSTLVANLGVRNALSVVLNEFAKAMFEGRYANFPGLFHEENIDILTPQGRHLAKAKEDSLEKIYEAKELTKKMIKKDVFINGKTYKAGLFVAESASLPSVFMLGQNQDIDITICKVKNKDEFGLRSRKNQTNVADIAKFFGGGGHQPAAGFPINDKSKGLLEYFKDIL